MQGRDLFATVGRPRVAVFSARDRCDETVDRIRSVRTERFKYIRNFYPRARSSSPIVTRTPSRSFAGSASFTTAAGLTFFRSVFSSPSRPDEELYDLQADPDELHNLAADPSHISTLKELRGRLHRWIEETGDRARKPESQAMYDSDMAVYLDGKNDIQDSELRKNIALMKEWASKGK